MKKDGSRSAKSRATRTAPFEPSSPGEKTSSAPKSSSSRFRSSVAFSGMTHVSGYPRSFATRASEMPVFPLVGSRRCRPGSSSPAASAASTIALATRSLIEPVGFWPSSFAKMRAPPRGDSRRSSTSGVDPTRSRRLGTTIWLRTAAGHGGQQDHGRAVLHLGLEPVQRAYVLALDVDVHERGDLVVVHELRAQAGKAADEIVQQLAHGAAGGVHLALAIGLGAKRRWDS